MHNFLKKDLRKTCTRAERQMRPQSRWMEIGREFNGSWTTGKEKRRVVQNLFLPNINRVGELSGHVWLFGLKHKYLFFYFKSA